MPFEAKCEWYCFNQSEMQSRLLPSLAQNIKGKSQYINAKIYRFGVENARHFHILLNIHFANAAQTL